MGNDSFTHIKVTRRHTARNLRFVLLLVCGVLSLALHAEERISSASEQSLQRYRFFADMPTQTLYKRALIQQKDGNEDSALTYYSVLYNRWNSSMTDAEKRLCAQSLLNAGMINYSRFNGSVENQWG